MELGRNASIMRIIDNLIGLKLRHITGISPLLNGGFLINEDKKGQLKATKNLITKVNLI